MFLNIPAMQQPEAYGSGVAFAGKAQSMKPRITEVFRRQDGEWKLVHRHADMDADPKGG